jgi:hypothetical protein
VQQLLQRQKAEKRAAAVAVIDWITAVAVKIL